MSEAERLNVPLGRLAFPRFTFSFRKGDSDAISSPLWGHWEGQVRRCRWVTVTAAVQEEDGRERDWSKGVCFADRH